MAAPSTVDTKQKLIDTALELLWKNSYGSVSVDDICKASNVKKGSFYHFFPSKMDLALAAMEQDLRMAKDGYTEVFSPSIDPLMRFDRLVDAIYEYQSKAAEKYGHVCGCPCTSIASEMAGQSDDIRAKFEEITSTKKKYFDAAIRDLIAQGKLPSDTDVNERVQEVYNYLMGEVMAARIHNDLSRLRADLKKGLKRILGVTEVAA